MRRGESYFSSFYPFSAFFLSGILIADLIREGTLISLMYKSSMAFSLTLLSLLSGYFIIKCKWRVKISLLDSNLEKTTFPLL
jgi:hypothetical protein